MLYVKTTWEESSAGRLQLLGRQERRQEPPAGLQFLGWKEVWQGAAQEIIQFLGWEKGSLQLLGRQEEFRGRGVS
jgi:hypothetical protein